MPNSTPEPEVKEVPSDFAKDVLSDFAKEVPSDFAKDVPSDFAKDVPSDFAKDVPQGVPAKDTPVAKLAKIADKHREHETFMRYLLSPDADIHAVKKMVGDLSRLTQRDLKRLEKLLTL